MLALAIGDVSLVQTVEPDAPEHFPPVLRLELGKIWKRRDFWTTSPLQVPSGKSPDYTPDILSPLWANPGVRPRHNVITARPEPSRLLKGARLRGNPPCGSQRRDWTERDAGYIRNANNRPRNGQLKVPISGKIQKPYEEKRYD
jgi:hypothetical protein